MANVYHIYHIYMVLIHMLHFTRYALHMYGQMNTRICQSCNMQ